MLSNRLSRSSRKTAILLVLVGILTMTCAYSLVQHTVVISSSGIVLSSHVVAKSGSSQDIQAAVNIVAAAGGGTVEVPKGNFTFNIANVGFNNVPDGVVVPGGVSVIGAGNNQTILFCPTSGWQSSTGGVGETSTYYHNNMFALSGSNNLPIRISGIMFQGSIVMSTGADDNYHELEAIAEYGVRNYRVDHCTFINFCQSAVGTSNLYIGNHNGNCGVIDHCVFDNPYKNVFWNLTGNHPIWGYGIIFGGDDQASKNWRPLSQVLGQFGPDIQVIESNSFRRCRHCVAGTGSGSGGWAVIRYNNCTDNISEYLGSFIDCHGGGRGYEVYDNRLIDVPADYRSFNPGDPDIGRYFCRGVNPRGGSGVIFNNTIINCASGVVLSNDQNVNATWRLNQFWVWGNAYISVATQLYISPGAYNITLNGQYYLRAPTHAQDGFTYTPLAYPMFLVNETYP